MQEKFVRGFCSTIFFFYGTFQRVTRKSPSTCLRITVAREIIPNLEAVNAWVIACYSHVHCSVSHSPHTYFAVIFFLCENVNDRFLRYRPNANSYSKLIKQLLVS